MNKLCILLTILGISFFTTTGFSQQNNFGNVSGEVINDDQTPFEYATIELLKSRDSTLVRSAFSDSIGKYEFENVPMGNYLISVSVTGTKKSYSKAFSVATQNETLIPTITLSYHAEY